jgi:anti-sigma-K factor RskA
MNEAEFERQMLRRLGGAMSEAESRALEEALRRNPAWGKRFALWQSVWKEAAGAQSPPDRELSAPLGLKARIVSRAAAGEAEGAAADRRGLWGEWVGAPVWQRAGSVTTAGLVLALGVALGVFLTPAHEVPPAAPIAAIGVDGAAGPADSVAATQVAETGLAADIPYLLGESGGDSLELSGAGLGEAGLAVLEELFDEANAS